MINGGPKVASTTLVRKKPGFLKLPTLRFRAKVTLGFAAVLLISAVSMVMAYVGFERIANGVVSYRTTVAESGLARNIDRELTSYQALARYYVLTSFEADAKAAKTAEVALKDAIDQSMKAATDSARLDKVTRLSREFTAFTKIFANILTVKSENDTIAANQLSRTSLMLRNKIDDLGDTAIMAGLASVQDQVKEITTQFITATSLVNTYIGKAEDKTSNAAQARIKFLQNQYATIYANDDKINGKLKEIVADTKIYADAFVKFVENTKKVDGLAKEMSESAAAITKLSGEMKADMLSEQHRMETESDKTVTDTKQLVTILGIGGFVIGAILAMLLGRSISKPMTAMCAAMRKLAAGDFDVVLPGLGRRDELGDMASAVEEFKVQAVAKAERDAAAQEESNRAADQMRRGELIRFADQFESAVGSIVSSVSVSSGQLEGAANTLTRTAETTEQLSGQAAATSDEASSNMQSVATATEELSLSVNEIGRQVQNSSRIAESAVDQARQTDARIGELSRAAQRIGDVVDLITAIAEQTNLLALNATIEAARAGDAGRGFAVVASEVKSLADQTAKATDEIRTQIGAMQQVTSVAVGAIRSIGQTITEINEVSTAIATAVEQQGAATREIARNIQHAAGGTSEVSSNIVGVSDASTQAGVAANEVLGASGDLRREADTLRGEIDEFLTSIRAA